MSATLPKGRVMKKPRKTAWEENVKPESPSLRMAKFGGGVYSNKERVEEAKKHLLELLKNPYYYEAYQQLHKKLPGRRPGRLPGTGELARDLQWHVPKPNRHAHRPRKDDNLLDLIARVEDNNKLILTQLNALTAAKGEFKGTFKRKKRIDICRDLVTSHREIIQGMWPDIRDPQALAKKLAAAVGNYRRGRY